jgi:hypothetical protein
MKSPLSTAEQVAMAQEVVVICVPRKVKRLPIISAAYINLH